MEDASALLILEGIRGSEEPRIISPINEIRRQKVTLCSLELEDLS